MGSDGFAQSMCQMYRCSVVIIALTACVPLHETMDYRRASLQTEYEPDRHRAKFSVGGSA